MERFKTAAKRERPAFESHQSDSLTESAERRLAVLLKLNEEHSSAYGAEDFAPGTAADHRYVFSFLGLTLGLFPPGALFLKLTIAMTDKGDADISIVAFLSMVVAVATCVGFFTGRTVGKVVRAIESFSWAAMLAVIPFIGLVWGVVVGSAAGAVIFLIGAIPGAVIGGAVGASALSLFSILHRTLKRGDKMAYRHIYPTTIGIAAVIAAFFLALPIT